MNIFPKLDVSEPNKYETEDLWNYELGLRSELLNGALMTQFTFFYMDRDDAQLRSSSGEGILFNFGTENGGKAEQYGAEFEGTWYINQNWTLSAGLGLLDAELSSTGNELSSAPSYNYNARVDYAAENGFFASVEVTGSDDFYETNNPNGRDQSSQRVHRI